MAPSENRLRTVGVVLAGGVGTRVGLAIPKQLLKIAGKPAWWLILFLIPLVNLVIAIIAMIALAKAFGKGTGFGLGLAFLRGVLTGHEVREASFQ